MTRVPKYIKSTHQILKEPNHILHSLYTQSQELLRVEQTVHRHIDEKVSVASFKNNELTLTAVSGAVATKIRYRQRKLISTLRRGGLDVNIIKIKVQPTLSTPEQPVVERYLSPENAHQLVETAQYIEHEPLRKALIALSKRSD